jgi:hypothetical protein
MKHLHLLHITQGMLAGSPSDYVGVTELTNWGQRQLHFLQVGAHLTNRQHLLSVVCGAIVSLSPFLPIPKYLISYLRDA